MSVGQSRTPELAEVVKAAIAEGFSGLHVAMPGKVEKYDPILQKADVKPLIQRPVVARDGTESLEPLPVIPEVPVCFPRGGGFFCSFPLAKGDNVLLVFCDLSTDAFAYSTGSVDTDPVDLRQHDLTDAVAIPGFYPFPKAIKSLIGEGAAFGSETGAQVRAKGDGIEVTSNGLPEVVPPLPFTPPLVPPPKGFVAMAAKMADIFNKHSHATLGAPPSTLINEGAIASSNLKADS